MYRTYSVGTPTPDVDDATFAEMQNVRLGAVLWWGRSVTLMLMATCFSPPSCSCNLCPCLAHARFTLARSSPPCAPPPPQRASWLETSKRRSSLTGGQLGGSRRGDLLSFVDDAVAAASSPVVGAYYKLVHLSGHYNTQLGVLGALGVDQEEEAADVAWLT